MGRCLRSSNREEKGVRKHTVCVADPISSLGYWPEDLLRSRNPVACTSMRKLPSRKSYCCPSQDTGEAVANLSSANRGAADGARTRDLRDHNPLRGVAHRCRWLQTTRKYGKFLKSNTTLRQATRARGCQSGVRIVGSVRQTRTSLRSS